MVYEVTFSKADRWQRLPYVKLLSRMENNGIALKMEVVVEEEDTFCFEEELDHHPHVKRWRRFGGNDWCEVTTTLCKARNRA